VQIIHVVGARPNFMKVAPVLSALQQFSDVEQILVHTGQHYDKAMSDIFFKQLELPEPDINLGVGSASHAVQTAQIMMRFEQVAQEHQPTRVVVYGDVNSTVAAALVCAKLGIPIDHVEAGLRSFNRTMPEEINRVITDQIADLLFTPSQDGDENLKHEGLAPERIHFVGNVMIDTLVRMLPKLDAINKPLVPAEYALVTLHRPSNVDDAEILRQIMTTLREIGQQIPIIFPMHPRTQKNLQAYAINVDERTIQIWNPVGYLEFLHLQKHARFVLTDSGGIQGETTFLRTPCLTLRQETEQPITVTHGTNQIVGHDFQLLKQAVQGILDGDARPAQIPPLWDGQAGERIAKIIFETSKAQRSH